jgi:hypothetical protein
MGNNSGQDLTWTGSAGDNNWSNATNWETGAGATASASPGASDTATIDSTLAGVLAVVVFGLDPVQAASLTLGGAVEFQTGTFDLGTISENAGVTTTVDAGASLETTGSYVEAQNAYIESYGTVNIGGPLVENASHVIDVWGGSSFTVGSVTPDVSNVSGSGATYNLYGGALTVTGDFSGANDAIYAEGGAFTVAGIATLNGDVFNASSFSTITLSHIGSLSANNSFSVFDSNSAIELGGANDAQVGQFVLDNGQTLSGGGQILAPEIVINGIVGVQGGAGQQLDGAILGSGSFQIGANGNLTFNGAVDASAKLSVTFSGAGGELFLNATAYEANGGFAPDIKAFQLNDTIDLIGFSGDVNGLSAGVLESVAVNGGNTLLTISGYDTNGTAVSDTLTFDGVALDSPSDFQLQYDESGGTFVTTSVTPCYCKGTRILAERGAIAVEDLRVGDRVVTADGASRPIVWIGRRALDIGKHPTPEQVWPVRILAHAFGEDSPQRDLWVSPGHNIACNGALIPACALINGVSVAQVKTGQVEYWHVELDAHDIILAEGLPAESYLDCGNRTGFANGGAYVEAHPDFLPKHWAETCLPLMKEGPEVAATKAGLIARSQARGYALTGEAEAHIVADGRKIGPVRLSETRLAFVLPGDVKEIVLRSRTFVPAQTMAMSADTRELGLCVERLQIDGEIFALDRDEGFGFGFGWHEAEQENGAFTHRWTKGAAILPAGARFIIVDLAGSGLYWREPNDNVVALFG